MPDLARDFRAALLVALSWVHRRLAVPFSCFPWRLAAVADTRLDLDRRERIAKEAFRAQTLCADPYFLRRALEHHVTSHRDFLSDRWVGCLLTWSRSVRCSVAMVEFLHGQNRRRAHQQMVWSHFSALFVLAEKKTIATVNRAAAANFRAMLVDPSSVAPAPPLSPLPEQVAAKWLRAKAVTELVRIDMMNRDRQAGVEFNACSEAYWQEVQSTVAGKSQEELEHYLARAEQSADMAKANRAAHRANAKRQDANVPALAMLPAAVGETASLQTAALSHSNAVAPFLHCRSRTCLRLGCGSGGANAHHHAPLPPLPLDEHGGLSEGFMTSEILSSLADPPLDKRTFQRFFEIMKSRVGGKWHGRRLTCDACVKDFVSTQNVPATDVGFPEQLQYRRACGPVCRTRTLCYLSWYFVQVMFQYCNEKYYIDTLRQHGP